MHNVLLHYFYLWLFYRNCVPYVHFYLHLLTLLLQSYINQINKFPESAFFIPVWPKNIIL